LSVEEKKALQDKNNSYSKQNIRDMKINDPVEYELYLASKREYHAAYRHRESEEIKALRKSTTDYGLANPKDKPKPEFLRLGEQCPEANISLFYNVTGLDQFIEYSPDMSTADYDKLVDQIRACVVTAGKKQDMLIKYMKDMDPRQPLYSCSCCGERRYGMKVVYMPLSELQLLSISRTRREQYDQASPEAKECYGYAEDANNQLYYILPFMAKTSEDGSVTYPICSRCHEDLTKKKTVTRCMRGYRDGSENYGVGEFRKFNFSHADITALSQVRSFMTTVQVKNDKASAASLALSGHCIHFQNKDQLTVIRRPEDRFGFVGPRRIIDRNISQNLQVIHSFRRYSFIICVTLFFSRF
jgi:hypothetical protein